MAINLGRKAIIKIDVNGVGGAGASWQPIGQEVSSSLSRETDATDATVKADAGWRRQVATGRGWGITCEGNLDPADSAVVYALGRWESETTHGTAGPSEVWIQRDASGYSGGKKEGKALIMNIGHDDPKDEKATFTFEFSGQGALVTSP